MRRSSLAAWSALLVAATALAAGPAGAQSLDDKLRAQLRTVLGQLHDLQNAQADLQAQKAAAEQERDALKAKVGTGGRGAKPSAEPRTAALQAELDQAKADNARLTEAVQQAQAETAKYKDAYSKVVESNQQIHAERDLAAQQSASLTQSLADCETKNIELVKISRDVLAAYTKVGVGDALKRGEPMIGLKRVQMERIAQDYGDKVYEAKFDARMAPARPKPAEGKAPPPAAAATSPAQPAASAAPPAKP
jgi:hypothetical protein